MLVSVREIREKDSGPILNRAHSVGYTNLLIEDIDQFLADCLHYRVCDDQIVWSETKNEGNHLIFMEREPGGREFKFEYTFKYYKDGYRVYKSCNQNIYVKGEPDANSVYFDVLEFMRFGQCEAPMVVYCRCCGEEAHPFLPDDTDEAIAKLSPILEALKRMKK